MIDIATLEWKRLTKNIDLSLFDCGCPDLNGFLKDDALNYANDLISTTFVYLKGDTIVAFVSYSNDKITADPNIKWNNASRGVNNDKRDQVKGYPAVKIGRLGINIKFQKQKLGTQILNFTKMWFIKNNKTGCRFITLDAYTTTNTLEFYKNNGFKILEAMSPGAKTVLMQFDLIKMIKK